MVLRDPCNYARLLHACLFTLFLTITAETCHAAPQTQTTTKTTTQTTTQTTTVPSLSDRIVQDHEDIQTAERQSTSPVKIGILWARLGVDYSEAADFSRSEDAYNRAIQLLKNIPEAGSNYATVLDNLGNLYLIYNHPEQAANCMKKALAIRQQLGDEIHLAMSYQHLADLSLALHKLKEAEREASQAYHMLAAAGPPHQADTIAALITLAYVRCDQNKCAEGLRNAEQALSIVHTAYAPNSMQVANAFMALGYAQWKMGHNQDAESAMLQGLQIIKTQTVQGDPILYYALTLYRTYLRAMHRDLDVKQVDTQIATASPQPCAGCSISIATLSNAMR